MISFRFPELCTPNSRFVEQFESITNPSSETNDPIFDKVGDTQTKLKCLVLVPGMFVTEKLIYKQS